MLTILGAVFGGLLRLAPEVLKFFTQKADQAHELAMIDRQAALAEKQAGWNMAAAAQQGQITLDGVGIQALIEGIKAQGQLTGIKWVDAVSQTVRPFITYWWMWLFTAVKAALLTTFL